MEKFDNNFKFEESYKKLTSVHLVDPQTVIIDGKYTIMNKQPSKTINENYGMRSLQFSSQLYNHDKELWEALRDKKDDNSQINEYKESHYAVIIDDSVVSILDNNTYISSFMKIISKYVEDESLKFFYNYNGDDEFQFIVLKDHNPGQVGFIIRYYLSGNWIIINYVYYSEDGYLFVSPSPVSNKEVSDDLEIILNKEELLTSCNLVYDEYELFKNRSLNCKISMEELFSYLKYDFNLKIKYTRIDPINYIADHDEYSTEVSTFLQEVLTYIYDTDMYRYVNSSYLKKSIGFSQFSFYEYYKVLSSMYIDNLVNINSLINLVDMVMRDKTNFSQINE